MKFEGHHPAACDSSQCMLSSLSPGFDTRETKKARAEEHNKKSFGGGSERASHNQGRGGSESPIYCINDRGLAGSAASWFKSVCNKTNRDLVQGSVQQYGKLSRQWTTNMNTWKSRHKGRRQSVLYSRKIPSRIQQWAARRFNEYSSWMPIIVKEAGKMKLAAKVRGVNQINWRKRSVQKV